jgi:hypothetical protein
VTWADAAGWAGVALAAVLLAWIAIDEYRRRGED